MRTKGWQKVFSFTFIQHIKTRSFIAGTIVVCLIVALLVAGVNIIPKLIAGEEEDGFGSSGSENGAADLAAVYLSDEAGIFTPEDTDALKQAGLKLEELNTSAEECVSQLADTEDSKALVKITADEVDSEITGYRVKTYYSPKSDSDSVDALTSLVSERVNYRNMLNAGVTPESYAMSTRYVQSSQIEAGSNELNMIEGLINYIVPFVTSIVLFMLIFAYGSTVAQSIAMEKTSRVMELLLTSVRPLAVVIGKVLAMGLVSILQFMLIGVVGGIAFAATAPFGIGGDIMNIMSDPQLQQLAENAEIVEAVNSSLGNINPFNILLVFVIFILGFLFFALIAALAGASIGRIEDLQQAMQPLSLLGMVGLYLAYFPSLFNAETLESGAAAVNPMQIFSYYFPVSSPFALPGALLMGSISPLQAVLATLLLAVFVVLAAVIVSKVYEGIILHNGNRIKFGDILKMAVRK